MSEIQDTTKVTAPLSPTNTGDVYPTHDEQYGKGGYRTVADITARDAISTERKTVGMLVSVASTGITYKLTALPNTWTAADLGSGHFFGALPPENPEEGWRWTDPATLRVFTYFVDGTSSQWVDLGDQTFTGDPAPYPEFTQYDLDQDVAIQAAQQAADDAQDTADANKDLYFKGRYASLGALQAAHPTSNAGAYAEVDLGVGNDLVRYAYDVDDVAWLQQLGEASILTDLQIKTQNENNANTNAFTDAEKTTVSNQSGTNTGDQDKANIDALGINAASVNDHLFETVTQAAYDALSPPDANTTYFIVG